VVAEIIQAWVLTLPATILFGHLFASAIRALVGVL
jgi:phosphate/sulfate permease